MNRYRRSFLYEDENDDVDVIRRAQDELTDYVQTRGTGTLWLGFAEEIQLQEDEKNRLSDVFGSRIERLFCIYKGMTHCGKSQLILDWLKTNRYVADRFENAQFQRQIDRDNQLYNDTDENMRDILGITPNPNDRNIPLTQLRGETHNTERGTVNTSAGEALKFASHISRNKTKIWYAVILEDGSARSMVTNASFNALAASITKATKSRIKEDEESMAQTYSLTAQLLQKCDEFVNLIQSQSEENRNVETALLHPELSQKEKDKIVMGYGKEGTKYADKGNNSYMNKFGLGTDGHKLKMGMNDKYQYGQRKGQYKISDDYVNIVCERIFTVLVANVAFISTGDGEEHNTFFGSRTDVIPADILNIASMHLGKAGKLDMSKAATDYRREAAIQRPDFSEDEIASRSEKYADAMRGYYTSTNSQAEKPTMDFNSWMRRGKVIKEMRRR